MEHITQEELDRFNDSCEKVGDCKRWRKYLDKDGYGTFYFRKKSRRAHRVAYYMVNGQIPDGMVVDHICRNRNCVEITHLRLVTTGQNSLENSKSVGAINAAKILCKQGHQFDRIYGTNKSQRYCSVCEREKSKRLRKKWLEEANKIKC